MWKMFGWVGRAIAVGLIASFLSVWTTGYIVNSYLESILKQYNLPLEVQPFALSGVWGRLWGADPVDEGTSVAEAGDGENSGIGSGSGADDGENSGVGSSGGTENGENDSESGGEYGSEETGGNGQGDPADEASSGVSDGDITGGSGSGNGAGSGTSAGAGDEDGPEDGESNEGGSTATGGTEAGGGAESVTGGTGGGGAGTNGAESGSESEEETTGEPVAIDAFGQEEEGTITGSGSGTGPKAEAGGTGAASEEISGTSGQITDAERDELFDLLATKLPQQAWQSISTYMENGLTEQEVTNVQQIVAQYLSEEQYKTFMSILKKY